MKKQHLALLPLALFVLLAIAYVADPQRHSTRAMLCERSRHMGIDNILSSLNVTAIAQDANAMVWIGTSAGINVFNGHEYIQFSHDASDTTALPDDYINTLHLDPKGRMWVGTQNGVACYMGGYRFRRFVLPVRTANVSAIFDAPTPADSAAVAVAVGSSCFRIDSSGRVSRMAMPLRPLAPTVPLPDDAVALDKPLDLVQATFVDADSNVWIGYRNAGVQVLSENVVAYRHANDNALARNTSGHDIVALTTVGRHILAGTTLRLHVYNGATGQAGYVFYRDLFSKGYSSHTFLNNIVPYDTCQAWLVGNHHILRCQVQGTRVRTMAPAYYAGPHVLGCGTRMAGHLYVPRSDGRLVCLPFARPSSTPASAGGEEGPRLMCVPCPWFDDETQLAALPDGRLLFFMRGMRLAVMNVRSGQMEMLHTTGIAHTANIDPAFVRIDSRGQVWLGTKRSGLYRLHLSTRRIERMPFPQDVHIQAMQEDTHGQLWITTLKDVVCYQPATHAVLMNSLVSASPSQARRQYFDNAICLSPDGQVVLGSSDGCFFVPSSMAGYGQRGDGLCVYALDVKRRDGTMLSLNAPFGQVQAFTFAHDENDLTLRFFYPNYARRSSLMYQCRLEGYDTDWQSPSYTGTAHYANLPPGTYTFRLRLVTSPQQPPVAERRLTLRVKAAPWQSGAAWVLYVMVVAALLAYINTLYLRIRSNRLRLAQEQREREREQRMNEMNMSFFANIAHEFRNPITLIAGPLMALRADTSLAAPVRRMLGGVCLSVNRMLRLIDQMLDFNQLEADALRLRVAHTDAAEALRGIVDAFEQSARVRGISLHTHVSCSDAVMWLDVDKFEKILNNLFTNALKHTPDNGCIAISMEVCEKDDGGWWLVVQVYNSGSHIAADRLADVFKRYYQLADAHASHKYGWGTGIGLYYVKRLVGLHHGAISVANVVGVADGERDARAGGADGENADGVAFTFMLPMQASSYSEDERNAEPAHAMQIPMQPDVDADKAADEAADVDAARPAIGAARGSKEKGRQRPRLLIVDDDVDVAQYIRSLFAGRYEVENRYSAESALRDMGQIHPDIVLSDVVMGEMSGLDFCRALKHDLMYSHIPVVLITAKSEMEEQIGGLRLGAVAYVIKPFNPSYLCALVEAQLDNVRKLRIRLGDSVSTEAVADGALSEQDCRFMDELYAIMERRSAEQELSVATVSRDMLVSQSKFNYKLKELTGDTPGVFFRKYKLNHAARLLREGRYNVSEVAALTGFSTAAHFAVAFKKQFGVVPSEYVACS